MNHSIPNYSFKSLLAEYHLLIPIIQRDYAQGRDGSRTEQIRREIVADLKNALISDRDTPPLDLGLVYGSLNEKKQLILIDGQQRLTTLYLLHWYLAQRAALHQPIDCGLLNKFTYETRVSSREFCAALVQPEHALNIDIRPSEAIMDASWADHTWSYDPTVKSMLTMLDEIHLQFSDLGHLQLWERLNSDALAVKFQFLDMKKFSLNEDLYIKMNARGCPLTDFEKIKAWIEYQAKKQNFNIELSDWNRAIDKEWTDLFWLWSSQDPVKMDSQFLSFLKNTALNFALLKIKPSELALQLPESKISANELINKVKSADYLANDYLVLLFTEGTLNECFKLLNILSNLGIGQLKQDLSGCDFEFSKTKYHSDPSPAFLADITSETPSAKNRLLFHALAVFLKERKDSYNTDDLLQWMRIWRNLCSNSPNLANNEVFTRAIKSISSLSAACAHPLQTFAADPERGIPGFSGYQITEEIRKARLMASNPQWITPLQTAENHDYFEGQITFLLEMSNDNFDQFSGFSNAAIALFTEDHVQNDDDARFQRALLTKGDYFFHEPNKDVGYFKSEWRKHGFKSSKAYNALRHLFSDINPKQSILPQLDQIIEASSVSDWRRHFIYSATIMRHIHKGRIQRYNNDYFVILEKSTRGGSYWELRTLLLHEHHLLQLKDHIDPLIIDINQKQIEAIEISNAGLYPKLRILYDSETSDQVSYRLSWIEHENSDHSTATYGFTDAQRKLVPETITGDLAVVELIKSLASSLLEK